MASSASTTTTISSIAVQSGNTRLVIALLQSGDVLELRIQELSPEMSDVGSNHEEALHLQQQHQQVLQKLQNKQSPVEELLSQADELIANQKPKAQVYSAMAHNLGLAWKNLNAQLEHRSIVLDTAVQYHAAAKKLSDELAKGEQEFSDTVLPDHVAACEARLQKLNEARKAILEASKRSLQPFQNLLQTLKEVANTGDSRPLQPAAALAAIATLESQHENLQDQRRKLGLLCEARKEALEKRLKALLLNKELDEVERQLELSPKDTALGDSPASSEILLHEHTTRIASANEKLRDRMLKLLKSAKQIQDAEVEARAFDLMARVTSRIERDEARKRDLKEAVEFFNEAQTALNKLDQLQIQVSQGPVQDLAAATTLLDACVERPLSLGHGILTRLSVGTGGVQEKVDELQCRHLQVRQMYEQKAADVVESSERTISFLTQCNSLYKWCIEVVQTFLERNSRLDTGAAAAHDFLQRHQKMLNELQAREPQLTILLAQDDSRSKDLLQLWQHLRNLLEQRIRIAQRYLSCCKLSTQLMEDLKTIGDAGPERQASINENFMQFDHNANNFLHDAQRIQDTCLDVTKALRHIQETLDQCHQLKNNPGSNTEQLIKDAQKTMESAVKIESELYPAIPRELNRAETIAQYLGRHLDTLMPLVRTIQSELDARIEATYTLQRKDHLVQQLRSTHQSFQKNISQYQDLVRAMISFFDYFSQLEKKLQETHDHEAVLAEAKQRAEKLALLVDKTEPSEAAVLDRDKIHSLVDNQGALLAASLRKSHQDSQMSKFNEELHLINQQVRELTDSLKRDSSKCHVVEFQQRIQSLERRIEVLSTSSRLQTDSARMELEELTSRWRNFHKEAMAVPQPQLQLIERKEVKEVCGPSFVVPLDDVEVQEGAKCSLVCVLAGHPPPTVQWYKDGVSIRGNSDYVTTSQPLEDGTTEQKLTIEETLADDSAKFCCKAINAAGLAETSCRLSVREQARESALEEVFIEALEEHTTQTAGGVLTEPTFVHPLPAIAQLRPGEELRLECTVQGRPEPRVSWSKDLLPVRDAAKPTQEQGRARLVLAGATENDSGTYTAVAKNKAGETACSCQVKVAEDASPPEPPRVLKALEDLEVKPGPDLVTLECVIVGRPEPEVIWYHNTQPIKESERVRLLFRGDKCSLLLNGISTQNAGTYRCSAVNPMGSCFTECKLRLTLSAPVFLEPLRDVTTDEGSRVVLTAKLWAPEPPFVHWFKDGRELLPSPDFQISHDPDGTVKLLIPMVAVNDSGHYEVEASNPGGRTRTGCRMLVREAQKAVQAATTQLAVSRTSKQTVSVSKSGSELRLARSLPSELVVQSGTKVCLSVACAQPPGGQLTASWFRSGQPITDSPDFRLTRSLENVAGTSLAVFSLTISEAFPEDSGDLEVRVQSPNGVVTANTKLIVLDEDDDGTDNVQRRDESIQQASEVKVYETKVPRTGPVDSTGLALSGDLQMRVTEVTHVNEMPPEVSEETTTKIVDHAGAKDKVTEEVTRRVTKRVTEITKTQTKELSTSRASRAAGPLSRVEPIPVAPEPKFDILEPKYDAPLLRSRPIRAPPPPLVQPEQSRPSLFEPLSVRTSFCLETGQFQSPRSIIRTKTASPVWSPKKKAVVIAENPATGQRVSAPVFLQGPEDVFAVPGQPATLRALLTGCPAPRLRWFKDGLPVHGPDHVVGQPSGPAPWTAWLSIPEAFPEDSGVYVCTASNLVGNTSACCRLTVFETGMVVQPAHTWGPPNASPPTFEPITQGGGLLYEGSDAKFQVKVHGNPPPEVVFTRRGMPLRGDPRRQVTYDPTTGICCLHIRNLTAEDDGDYNCSAVNCAGEASLTLTIRAAAAAVMRGQMQHMTTVQKTQVIDSRTHVQDGVSPVHYFAGHDQTFRVDTFEYRLLREVEFRQFLIGHEQAPLPAVPGVPISAPMIQARPRNSKLLEGSDATFTVKIASNPPAQVYWFRNGERLQASQRVIMEQQGSTYILRVHMALPEDAGYYTVLAVNQQGCVACSAHLVIESMPKAEETRQADSSSFVMTETSRTLKPSFTKIPQDQEVTEGKMVRFDLRVSGRPFPDISWLRNGVPVNDDATHKLLVNEGGQHALMITAASREDAGTWTCIANNKSGECRFEVHLVVIEKEQVVAPKFVERFQSLNVREGESVTLHCRAVGTPTPRITWQKDGRQIHSQPPNLIIETQEGSSALYLNRAAATDSAWYQCTAQNQAGSTATRARLHVLTEPKKHTEPWSLHLPKPTKVISPEKSPPRETIWLRHVERAYQPVRGPDDERAPQKPAFTTHLQDLVLHEGERGHLDARLIPIGDETMIIEWFCNGRPIEASSRVMTLYRFGYVALTLLHVYPEDSGVYVCRATNEAGEATTTATLRCTARPAIERKAIQEDSIRAIQELEDAEKYSRQLSIDETATLTKPVFIRPLSNKDNLPEGSNCHFEAQLTPVNDSTMKVEWFLNGQPLTTGSRINSTFSFGYVSLNIMSLRYEDSGVYMCRATNAKGEAVSTATLKVKAQGLVTGDLGIPEQEAYIRKTQELEAYQMAQHAPKEIIFEPVSTMKPNFKTGLRDQLNVKENSTVHFEARLEPTGDSSMRVEWFKDGRPLEASSRTTTFFNFGYVSLTIRGVEARDSGVYTCQATNSIGSATTQGRLVCVSQASIVKETQHPGGLQKIQHLEDSSHYQRSEFEEVSITEKPKFTQPLQGPNAVKEGQSVHFETRLEPMGDPNMKVEWFHNGRPLATGHRFKTYFDFGYVALDILYTFPEDTGTFEVRATNKLGTDILKKEINVQVKAAVDTSAIHELGLEKIEYLEGSGVDHSGYHIEEVTRTKPYFKVPLKDPKGPLKEGDSIVMECAIEPVQDSTMKVEWFFNGRPLPTGHRFITKYDFGRAFLQILNLVSEDTGQYTLRATNHLGSAHSTSCIKVIGKSGVITDSQYPEGWEKIQHLEDHSRYTRQEHQESIITQKPTFSRPLHNVETVEGANVHLECRLQPVGDSTLRVEWFRNSVPIKVGHRFRPAHEFDYVALDILSFYPEDSGIYTCKATSSLGESVTSCNVNCFAKSQLILESQHPEGLQKIQQLEDQSRFRREIIEETTVKTKPSFTSNMTTLSLREGQNAHLECRLEPVNDADLRVEWFHNGVSLPIGHRYRPFHDFGYVALNILSLVPEDSGTYTVRATNSLGKAELSTTILVEGKSSVDTDTQHPEGLQKIQALEGHHYERDTGDLDQSVTTAPVFTSAPKSIVVQEGQKAHLECRLIPVGDAKLKVEWFKNGQPVPAGSRFVEMCNFGFVSLDILSTYAEDSGTYTCKATNQLGEAVVSAQLKCHAEKSLILDTQNQEAYEKIQQLEDYGRQIRPAVVEEITTQAPVFTQAMKNLNLNENQSAHFECKLIPVGDPNLKVEWFHNGLPLQKANRVNTIHDFGFVALDLSYVKAQDSGTYTCKATNSLGSAVCSATLNVQDSKSLVFDTHHPEGLQKIRQLEELGRYKEEVTHEAPCPGPPMFVTQLQGPSRLTEGESAHLECRIAPYPDSTMKVQWFHNGVELQSGHRYRTMYDFGFCALDILSANAEHSGEYVVQATNELGTARSTARIHVDAKGGVILESQQPDALPKIKQLEESCGYIRPTQEEVVIKEKPNFVRGLYNLDTLHEGQSAHLEATLTPINDANMKVQWFHNGVEIPLGHRFKTVSDFGYVALNILYAYPEDSGTYMCKATNKLGEAVTTCSINVLGKSAIVTDTYHEKGLEKIRQLEEYQAPEKPEQVIQLQRPVFTVPLNSVDGLVEGQSAHMECRLEPINDADLKVQWYHNGVEIQPGHRFRTTHDFGYVALDILYVYAEDSGTYMCKATNSLGEAVTTCNLRALPKQKIFYDTHHPEGLEKIRELEAQVKYQTAEIQEKPVSKPVFITELRGTQEISEGESAHLECRVEPAHDAKLKIEVLHNGRPLTAATRVHITSDFGYVAIDVSNAIPEDSGTYTVRATNDLGRAETTATLRVLPKSSIISDTHHPEGLAKIREMEDEARFKHEVIQEPVTFQRPVFTVPLQNLENLVEDQRNVHLECRLIPVGDPTLNVQWFFNDTPLMEGTRFHPVHDFGYVALDMDYVRPEDTGVYTCKATNSLGQAVTTCMLKIKPKASILLDTLQPQGYEKIRELEDLKGQKPPEKPDAVYEKPVFTTPLVGPGEINEGQPARLECRCVPVGDPDLKFFWYVNGIELPKGSRLIPNNDFGFVTLDIMSGIAEDSGVYMCKAVNKAGEAVTSTSLRVKGRAGVLLDSHHPEAYRQTQKFEYDSSRIPETWSDEKPKVAPVFVQHLNNIDGAVEGHYLRIEGRIEPTNDDKLKVKWFKNGKPLVMGTRIKPTDDFGLVSLDISSARPDDSGIYTCKATNDVGEAISTCTIKVEGRENIILASQHPDSLPKIRQLEEYVPPEKYVPEPEYEGPVFVTHLNNLEIREGATAHFECRVEPSKDPTLKVEFLKNNKPVPAGSKYNFNNDFGFVTLDVGNAFPEDSGIYTCRARNSKGEAVTTGSLKVQGKSGVQSDTLHPMGAQGLSKVQELETSYLTRYQAPVEEAEKVFPRPVFVVPLEPNFSIQEGSPVTLECKVEPATDPKLKVEWFLNGKPLAPGSRYTVTHDFGFVVLALTDFWGRDAGIYTCRASNDAGEAFTTTTITCLSRKGVQEDTLHPEGRKGLESIQQLEESLTRVPEMVQEDAAGQPPVFTSQFVNLKDLNEGEIAHFEATLTPVGDQTMQVEWFFRGKPLKAGHRIRTVHAFGMVVLEILGTVLEDSGRYTCRATNKWGKAEVTVDLECTDKTKGQRPQFTTQLQNLMDLKEGNSAHLECHLVPVGDPDMKVEWYKNSQPLRDSSRIKTLSDFGYVVMDISFVHAEDSGDYVCVATNKYGSDATKCTIQCAGTGKIFRDSLQPQSLDRIAELEGASSQTRTSAVMEATRLQPPKFLSQLNSIVGLSEGQSAHFECQLVPVNDPDLTVEWYFNGQLLRSGHRFRTFHDFGIVILDILYCYGEDSGEWVCKATNKLGSDVTRATLQCKSKSSLILTPQLPPEMASGTQSIIALEESLYRTSAVVEPDGPAEAPRFTVPLSNVEDLREGDNAHLEARLTPTDDPDLTVEWFKNNMPLMSGTRIRTINDFGFVVLEMSPVYPEDSGVYSCRARNRFGEAVTSCTLKCQGKRSVILETQLPESMTPGIDKIAKFEEVSSARIGETWTDKDVSQPPKFITTPQDLTLAENSLAHFECRLTPVGDPTLRVDWYHNGKPLVTGSRVKTISDFGYVILEVAGVYPRDSGVYTCRAVNKVGEASVSCKLNVKGKQSIVMEPQLPQEFRSGYESIQKLEESMYRTEEKIFDDDKKEPPKFVTQIQSLLDKVEGDSAHFECKLIPVGDPNMKVEWFLNGRPLVTGTRVHTIDDFGFVVLDIDWLFPRDSGEYMCRATNRWGSDMTKATLKIKAKKDIIMDSQLPQGMNVDKLRDLEYPTPQEETVQEQEPVKPRFITQIQPQQNLNEGDSAHFECRLEPINDPKLRVEWYHNGQPLRSGHRFKTTHDFGFVALDVLYVYPEDSGTYVARAVNDVGEDQTQATLRCTAKPKLDYRTQLPKDMKDGVKKIAEMEASWQRTETQEEVEEEPKAPMFIMKPEPQVVVEGEWAKFQCRVIGHPKPRLIWVLNGHTVISGSRYKLTYDGIYHLDIPKSRQYDQGKVEVFARNFCGEAYCFTTLEVRPKFDDYRAVLKHSPKPWYDQDVKSYQKYRHETELQRVFEEKLTPGGTRVDVWKTEEGQQGEHQKIKKRIEEEEIERMKPKVERFKTDSIYYDARTGEKKVETGSQAQYMAKYFETEAEKQQRGASGIAPESVVQGREVHTTTQRQTQKEQQGDLEITRKKTLTETLEQEHKGVTKEQRVQGPAQESKPPVFTKKLQPCRVEEGHGAKFQCTFTGQPTPKVTWYRENFPITPSQDFQIVTTDTTSTLIIREVYVEDSGVFSVKAENRGGSAKSSANLVVEERREQRSGVVPPNFTRTIQDVSSKAGKLVRLDAKVSGSKPLDVYWLKNGKKVTPDVSHKIVEEDDLYTLLILEAQADSDSGSYECVAINSAGEARCQAHVVIEGAKPKTPPTSPKEAPGDQKPPTVTEPLKPLAVKEGQSAVFRCRIPAVPGAQVKWFRGDQQVKQSRYFRMSQENNLFTLKISEAFPEDEGVYKCVATNPAGTVSTSANLKVIVPELNEVPPTVTPLADLTVPEGSPARFVTSLGGVPPPKVIWVREGHIIKQSRDFQMNQDQGSASLVIRHTYPEDEGVYVCRATNASGQAETSARLTVQRKAKK